MIDFKKDLAIENKPGENNFPIFVYHCIRYNEWYFVVRALTKNTKIGLETLLLF